MSRIVTNVQSLVAQRVLGTQNRQLNQALTRLSTGLRINSGADDPAGLIASESLRSEKVAISAAIDNANRADNVLAVAEGALVEVNRLLLDLEDLIDRSASTAGLSEAELEANQAQIDAILQSIFFDPQTSGGLLVAVDASDTVDLAEAFSDAGLPLWDIGIVTAGAGIDVTA